MAWKTKGMNRDLSVSAFNAEFSFENINLRLSTNEGNTLMSWVNEKGPKRLSLSITGGTAKLQEDTLIQGIPIGTAVLNNQLVVFTHGDYNDFIYVFTVEDTTTGVLQGKILYKGNLNFSTKYPIETLVSYEANDIQKVYWTDNLNQPRLINIAASGDQVSSWNDTSFDFISTLKLNEFITVEKLIGAEGMFTPGVIQYAFTYYNKFGQESSIFYTSPLNYISYQDRGAAPNATNISNAFKISITNVDTNFDYVRIYSIHRTSLDAAPEVKQLTDIPLKGVKEYKSFSKTLVYNENVKYNLPIDTKYGNKKILTMQVENGNYSVFIDPDGIPIFDNTADVKIVAWYKRGEVLYKQDLMSFQEFIEGCMDSSKFDIEAEGHISDNCKNDEDNYYSYIKVEQDLDRYMRKLSSDIWHDEDTQWGLSIDGQLETGSVEQGMYEQTIVYNYSDQKWYMLDTSSTDITNIVEVNETKEATQYADTLTYTDTGSTGSTVDPTELLYKGGESVVVGTIEQKDNTLFLGNVNIQRQYIATSLKDDIRELLLQKNEDGTYKYITTSTRKMYVDNFNPSASSYDYHNQLTGYTKVNNKYKENNPEEKKSTPCGGFKRGDYYRLGVQFQYSTGKWSEPVFLDDIAQNHLFEENTESTLNLAEGIYYVTIPIFTCIIPSELSERLLSLGYKKVRGIVVFPSIQDRICLTQGVLNSTLYTTEHRETDKDLYAQSSWFFRFTKNSSTQFVNGAGAVYPESTGTLPYLLLDDNKPSEYTFDEKKPNMKDTNMRSVEIQGTYFTNNRFKIDKKFVTFHSPELVFDDQYLILDYANLQLQKVGTAQANITFSDIEIQTETPTIGNDGAGFIHKSFTSSSAYGIGAGLYYEDATVDDDDNANLKRWENGKSAFKWLVYPWQSTGSLNNDINRPANAGVSSSTLKKKIISNLRYTKTSWAISTTNWSVKTAQVWNSDQSSIIKINNNIYKGNIDTLLIPDQTDGKYFCFDSTDPTKDGVSTDFTSTKIWKTFAAKETQADRQGLWYWNSSKWENKNTTMGDKYISLVRKKDPVRMKYKSTPHLVMQLSAEDTPDAAGLSIVELRRTEIPTNLYGGTSKDALMANIWVPCGEPELLDSNHDITFNYSYGDTYFQRWDCLKTYPFTHEDPNQIVEIGSFMLETKLNIDGRYDRNRGQVNNLNMSPTNFNLYNSVYSQVDNFFNYRILDESTYNHTSFPNQITWTKTKQMGADVDLWTNLTLANTLDLDGDKGGISKLIRQNDSLIAFQDKGIAQILYNDNVQISSTSGVPIEIANSEKVQGKRYMSDTVGCSNKWSIAITPQGAYFIDSNSKDIYLLGQQLANISSTQGFGSWCKQNIPSNTVTWNPVDKENFVSYYDHTTQDVYFINRDTCLAFSEKTGNFSSFYSYDAPYLCNIQDIGLWLNINNRRGTDQYYIYQHRAGEYCSFFGVLKPFSMTLVGNADSQLDKTFTNLEFRAMVDGEGLEGMYEYSAYLPFDKLEAWNEYQYGISKLDNTMSMKHHIYNSDTSTLKRKFRVWRCDIPRDNAPLSTTKEGVFRTRVHPMNRIRNPWVYLKLENKGTPDKRVEIHDVVMTYLL